VTIPLKERLHWTGVKGVHGLRRRNCPENAVLSDVFRRHSPGGCRNLSGLPPITAFVNEAWPLGWYSWCEQKIRIEKNKHSQALPFCAMQALSHGQFPSTNGSPTQSAA